MVRGAPAEVSYFGKFGRRNPVPQLRQVDRCSLWSIGRRQNVVREFHGLDLEGLGGFGIGAHDDAAGLRRAEHFEPLKIVEARAGMADRVGAQRPIELVFMTIAVDQKQGLAEVLGVTGEGGLGIDKADAAIVPRPK